MADDYSDLIKEWEDKGYITQKRWRTVNDDLVCSICKSLDEKVVDLKKPFIVIEGKDIMHPPAHGGCRCWLQPVVSLEAAREQSRRRLGLDPE